MKLSTLLAAALALSVSCASDSSTDEAPAELGFRTILRGYDSAIAEAGARVAASEEEWHALWREHTANRIPATQPPPIDWSRDMVVLVTLGTRPSGGYSIEVAGVCAEVGSLTVDAVETKPAADAIVPMVMTAPYEIVATPRRKTSAVKLNVR